MTYKEYKGCKKTYVVVQKTGFGVMEAPYEEVGVVYKTNDLKRAENKAKKLFETNNTPEDIKSTWCNNTYWVNVNTLSDEGKKLLDEFNKSFDEKIENIDESKYEKIERGGFTFNLIKLPNMGLPGMVKLDFPFKDKGFIIPKGITIDFKNKYL